MRSLLGGRDTCVVMPTGGGKSLCYQLPGAMLPEKTVIVVSPLIALMQDQVAQLAQMGIPAALLNSSLAAGQQAQVMRKARAGEYRLLYLSPERLARADTLDWLQGIPVSFFAIDEAHCISEWGHEFRPEYRQLSRLRVHFPDRPIAAFTASATQRVRHDIIHQLQLRDPHKYIASFHRPNLRYVVSACDGRSQPDLLVSALRSYKDGNIIVYAPTIAKVEATADFLQGKGIPAIAYHGQMEADERRRNQERWMSDEVRVLVGTIAFGLGINKAAVRAVIHLSLPKSIEQYYQEAGRAGRDGLPADCVLLWQKRDAGLLAHFIEQITDPAEKERAWQRYHEIRGFVESKTCRHLQICRHFGETPEMEDVRRVRCLRLGAGLAFRAGRDCRRRRDPGPNREKRNRSVLQFKSRRARPPQCIGNGHRGPQESASLRTSILNCANIFASGAEARRSSRTLPRSSFCTTRRSMRSAGCVRVPSPNFSTISGIGERKAELYGRQILAALEQFAERFPGHSGAREQTKSRRRNHAPAC